jgi:hypothetical protein
MTPALREEEEDRIAQAAIRSGANKSLATLEKAFIRNGSGRYFVLRARDPRPFDPGEETTSSDRGK